MYVNIPPINNVLVEDPALAWMNNGGLSKLITLWFASFMESIRPIEVREIEPVFCTVILNTTWSPMSVTPFEFTSTMFPTLVTSSSAVFTIVGSLFNSPSLSIPLSLWSVTIPNVLDAETVTWLNIEPESKAYWSIVKDAT